MQIFFYKSCYHTKKKCNIFNIKHEKMDVLIFLMKVEKNQIDTWFREEKIIKIYRLFFKILFIYFLEVGEGREKEKVRNIDVLVASPMDSIRGLNPQPRHVPWPGIDPVTFPFVGWCPTESHRSGLLTYY